MSKIFIYISLLALVFVSGVHGEDMEEYTFDTADIAPDIKGLNGPIRMLVTVDKEGKITKVRMMGHSETPEYTAGLETKEFLDQFIGKTSEDSFTVGKDVDAVTRATVSSKAVAKTLKATLERIRSEKEFKEKKDDTALKQLNEAGLEPREADYYKVLDE